MIQSIIKLKNKKKGFTLVELIVVVAIIGVLAAILVPKYFGFTTDARKSAVLAEAKSIRAIADTYYAKNEAWPTARDNTAAHAVITTAATTGFTVGDPTVTNSPVFTGQIKVNTSTNILSDDGSFKYTKDGHEADCDAGGNVTLAS